MDSESKRYRYGIDTLEGEGIIRLMISWPAPGHRINGVSTSFAIRDLASVRGGRVALQEYVRMRVRIESADEVRDIPGNVMAALLTLSLGEPPPIDPRLLLYRDKKADEE